MQTEIGLWRIDGGPKAVQVIPMDKEETLETLIEQDVSLLGLPVLVLGRQVLTGYGGKIDILALDPEGGVYAIELKRDKTPRDVIAQALDYGSWVQQLTPGDLRAVYAKHKAGDLDTAFLQEFGAPLPEQLRHQLYIVASRPDASTERIVEYLSPFGVPINVLFFRHFVDGDRRYLARTWLIDSVSSPPPMPQKPWDGHTYYVAVQEGPWRAWDDLRRYGFVSAGGGSKYSKQLLRLQDGDEVFAYSPGHGYVGIGTVTGPRVLAKDFAVNINGRSLALLDAPLGAPEMGKNADNPELAEYVVPVQWTATTDLTKPAWQSGLFSNMLVVCALRSKETIEFVRLQLGA